MLSIMKQQNMKQEKYRKGIEAGTRQQLAWLDNGFFQVIGAMQGCAPVLRRVVLLISSHSNIITKFGTKKRPETPKIPLL